MATLERIRKRSGLLITVIGIAMLGFILTDLLGSGGSILAGNATMVGKINGRSIELNEFSREMAEYEKLLQQNQQPNQPAPNYTSIQIADGVWDRMLREELLEEQYEDLGFECTSAELYERLKANPNVQAAPVFKDQVTGIFNEALFQQYINGLRDRSAEGPEEALAYEQWLNFEKGTIDETKSNKYTTAISKGLYYPKALARTEYLLNNTSSTAKFAVLEYSTIADSTVQVTDSDIKKFYNEHKDEYEKEQARSFSYVSFKIDPSNKDRNEVIDELNKIKGPNIENGDTLDVETFLKNEDDSAFALSYTDQASYPAFYRKSNIPAPLDSTLFDQELGHVKGPYLDGNYYRLTKITDIKNLPDSVEARHILISYASANNGQGNQNRDFVTAQALADSLFAIVKADTAMFDTIALVNSDDGSATKGGDLGWFNDRTMVKPFSDFCFQNETGTIAIVPSIFGFHIIEILGQQGSTKAIELVTISREVIASDGTYDSIYNIASSFASSAANMEEFRARAEEKGYNLRNAYNIPNFAERIDGIPGNNRDIVKWAYKEDTKLDDIELFSTNGDDSYVVLILSEMQEEGVAPLESIEDDIRERVIKEKKAQMLIEKFEGAMGEGKDINAIATELGIIAKDQVTNFAGSAISGYGNEPKVIGVMGTVDVNVVSNPIEGDRGVYIVSVNNRVPASDLPDYTGEQTRLQNTQRTAVNRALFESLKDQANIKDLRAKFY